MSSQLSSDQTNVINASKSQNKTERFLACKKLGQETNRNVHPIWTALTERLSDPDKDVRRAAATSLSYVSRFQRRHCTVLCSPIPKS
jgi:hypothetical protein